MNHPDWWILGLLAVVQLVRIPVMIVTVQDAQLKPRAGEPRR